MLGARGADVHLPQLHAQGARELARVVERARGGAEAGHGHGQDPRPRQAEQVEGPRRDEERERRVEAAREPQRDAAQARVLETLRQPRGLDREDLLAALVEGGGIRGDERVPLELPDQAVWRRGRDGSEGHLAVIAGQGMHAFGEGRLPHALHEEALGVHVGHDQLAVAAEALALREHGRVLGDEEVAAEDDVGRGLVDAGVGIDVGGDGAARLHLHQLAAVFRLAHEVVRRRGAQQHGGPRHGVEAARRHGRPEVLADLHPQAHARLRLEREQQARAEGRRRPRQHHLAAGGFSRRREPALLVVLLVARQVGLRDDTQQPAGLDDRGRIEESPLERHGQPGHDHHRHLRRRAHQAGQLALGAADERLQAEEEVAGRVPRERQLGQQEDLHAEAVRPPHEAQDLVDVSPRIRDRDRRAGRGDAEEPVRGGQHEQRIHRLRGL